MTLPSSSETSNPASVTLTGVSKISLRAGSISIISAAFSMFIVAASRIVGTLTSAISSPGALSLLPSAMMAFSAKASFFGSGLADIALMIGISAVIAGIQEERTLAGMP